MATEPVGEVSALESRVLEANALALGLSLDELMENAGRAVAEEAARHLPKAPARVAIVAGVGNNGGDGTCAAFYLAQWGYTPEVWLLRSPAEITGGSARRCWDRIAHRLPVHLGAPAEADLASAELVVDAALGAGQHGELRSPYREAVASIERAHRPTLSVDVPTGLGTSTAVRPAWTVALTSRKSGMTPESSGEIVVRDIGIPHEAWSATGPGEFLRYPDAKLRADRGRSARVLVVGGGPFAGAPALAALGALRAGAERVTVLLPEPAAAAVRAMSPDLIVRSVGTGRFTSANAAEVVSMARELKVHAVVLGMGAGREPETLAMYSALLAEWRGRLPLVVDADALGALTRAPGGAAHLVATPNPAEYERVFGPDPSRTAEDRLETARRRATEWGVTLLVKGPVDLITDGRTAQTNPHHHPAATVGGVGDVLAGVLASLWAQGLEPTGAARLAAFWVGTAGARTAERRDFSLLATDVLDTLSETLVAGLRAARTAPGAQA